MSKDLTNAQREAVKRMQREVDEKAARLRLERYLDMDALIKCHVYEELKHLPF